MVPRVMRAPYREDDVVAAGQKFGFQIMKVELDQLLELFLHRILFAVLFEVAQAARVVHRFHLLLVVESVLPGAQAGVADI